MSKGPLPPVRWGSGAGVIQGTFLAGSVIQARGGQGSAVDQAAVAPRGPGQPLPEGVRRHMETAFKTDFSQVRVHVGPQAAAIGAIAFTRGNDIFFQAHHYNPQAPQGLRLLGHELAHVVQQRSGRVRPPPGVGLAILRDPFLEAEADRMAQRAVLAPPPSATVQRAAGPVRAQTLPPPPPRISAVQMMKRSHQELEEELQQQKDMLEGKSRTSSGRKTTYVTGGKTLNARQETLIRQKIKTLKEAIGEKSEDEEEPEKPKKDVIKKPKKISPPRGLFLKYGERSELSYVITSKTNGLTADEYILDLARSSGRPDLKSQVATVSLGVGVDTYQCVTCNHYYPEKSDYNKYKTFFDANLVNALGSWITIEHKNAASRLLEGSKIIGSFCDGTTVWEGIVRDWANLAYSDPKNLTLKCSHCNPSKGGKIGYMRTVPEDVGECECGCSHTDVRSVG